MSTHLLEGHLTKKSGAQWKRRFFVLTNDCIKYFTRQEETRVRGQLELNANTKVIDYRLKDFGFQVISNNTALMVHADDAREKERWMDAVKEAVQSLKDAATGSGVLRPNYYRAATSNTVFEIDSRYEVEKPIGHGAYGVVVKAKDHGTNPASIVAIKKITNFVQDLVDAKRIVREVRLLRHFAHENIIGITDILPPPTIDDFNDIYIISEFMETDLHRVIYSRQSLTDDHIKYFLYQILCGLRYIHSAEVLHRDLKPSNILLNSNCDLKLCDFGLSRTVTVAAEDDNLLTEYVVTRWYRAPEIMLSVQEYTKAIDVWSVGCIFAEMNKRKPLFPGQDYIEQLKLIAKFTGTPTREELWFVSNPRAKRFMEQLPPCNPVNLDHKFPDMGDDALDLLDKMLQLDPSKRVSVEDALKHPYLATLHDPTLEPSAEGPVDLEDIEAVEMSSQDTKRNLQKLLLTDILHFHSECEAEFRHIIDPSASRARTVPP
eukprot:CAMPEP_0118868512 /NCGR_PEP_ID=MMETSP1163-20130328/11981_1 /TAXON_ID=124430 /ORGANISM="Phaeomonas parva, Strain CCMP2877" /LENGTH=488 /DNA_ID=CAMNT_0006803205 /DNA_START=297 /DNA_END=1763 /DNA_ORIENTATION=+